MVPCGVFVVERVVTQATVQDPDEAVGQGAEGLMVSVAVSTVLVVVAASARAAQQGGEGPAVEGVVEVWVADVAGQDGFLLARGDRQR